MRKKINASPITGTRACRRKGIFGGRWWSATCPGPLSPCRVVGRHDNENFNSIFFFFTPALGDSLQAARPRSPERCQNPRRYTGFALLWRRSVRVFSTVIASVQLTSGLQLVPVFVISLQQSSSFAPTDIYTRPLLPSSIRTNNVPSSRPPPQHQGYLSR